MGEACAVWLEQLAWRIRQLRCVHTDYAFPTCYTTIRVAPKPLNTKPLLKGDSPSAGHRF